MSEPVSQPAHAAELNGSPVAPAPMSEETAQKLLAALQAQQTTTPGLAPQVVEEPEDPDALKLNGRTVDETDGKTSVTTPDGSVRTVDGEHGELVAKIIHLLNL